MMRVGLVFLCLFLTGCIARVDFEDGGTDGVVTTTAPRRQPTWGPRPVVVPAGARTIVMRPGGNPTPEQLDFMRDQPGYIEGSGRVEAYAPGIDGLKALLTWEADGSGFPQGPRPAPSAERMTCDALDPPSGDPQAWGCGTVDDWSINKVGGYAYPTEEQGRNDFEVHHAPGVSATVVELADGAVYVIRHPGDSTISYYEWNGSPPARVTVFWPDGTRVSELTTP